MWKRIHELKNQGMDTSRLEKAIKGDVDEAAKAFTDYDKRLGRLADIWNRLYSVDFRGFESEYKSIYAGLRDPYAVEDLEKQLDTLEKEVETRREEQHTAWQETQKKREEDLKKYNLEQVVMAWKSRGYKVDELEALLKEDLDKTREALAIFETAVNNLWEIGKKLQTMDVRGFETEYNEIRALLYDTSKVEEAQTKLDILLKKVGEKAKESSVNIQDQMAGRAQWEAQRQVDEKQKLQEEARKAAEEKRKAKEEWEKKIAEERQAIAKAKLYLNKLTSDMKETSPNMSPMGKYLGDKKWVVEKDLDKLEVVGKSSLGLFSDHLFIVGHFMSAAQLPTVNHMVSYFKSKGEEHKQKGQYRVDCIIMNRVSKASIDAVKKFSHKNCAPLLYDIYEDKIYYNEALKGADFFAGYFSGADEPKSLKEIFKPILDEFEVVYKKDVGPHFNMDEQEVERMYKHLVRTNKVYPVEKRKGSFAFA